MANAPDGVFYRVANLAMEAVMAGIALIGVLLVGYLFVGCAIIENRNRETEMQMQAPVVCPCDPCICDPCLCKEKCCVSDL